MKIGQLTLAAISILLFVQCKTQQYTVGQSRNGKCYAKCLMIDQVITEVEEYTVYTGNENEEEVELIEKEIIIQPESRKWVKKKADRNCLSADPDDCLVWCLVETEPVTRTITVLADTSQSQNYKVEKIEREVERVQGRSFVWKEVACENDVTEYMIRQIQNRLHEKRYYDGAIHGEFNSETKEALTAFQENNKLPQGQLDFETLDVLGVVID